MRLPIATSVVTVIMAIALSVWVLAIQPESAHAARLKTTGKLTLLRVHDVGTGYGPDNDHIDVEVVVHISSQPGKAFGFQLRDDNDRVARQGMLDLLRDAFNHNWTTTLVYDIPENKNNGVILRTWITK